MSENIEILVAALPNLSAKDAGFASSLIAQHAKKGSLSDKQWYWVNRLAGTTAAPAAPEATKVGNVSKIVELLDTAKQHLKRPAILVRVNDQDLRLNIAGQTAKVPGSINVLGTTVDSQGMRPWYGRVTREGEFQPSRKFDAQTQTAVAAALIALANDPAQAAADYGKLTGVCCFCNHKLGEGEDKRSVEVGYGPVCAKHWGLPWGDVNDA